MALSARHWSTAPKPAETVQLNSQDCTVDKSCNDLVRANMAQAGTSLETTEPRDRPAASFLVRTPLTAGGAGETWAATVSQFYHQKRSGRALDRRILLRWKDLAVA